MESIALQNNHGAHERKVDFPEPWLEAHFVSLWTVLQVLAVICDASEAALSWATAPCGGPQLSEGEKHLRLNGGGEVGTNRPPGRRAAADPESDHSGHGHVCSPWCARHRRDGYVQG